MRAPLGSTPLDRSRPRSGRGVAPARVVVVGKSRSGRFVRRIGTTDGQGNYEFADLPAGTYIVQENGPGSSERDG